MSLPRHNFPAAFGRFWRMAVAAMLLAGCGGGVGTGGTGSFGQGTINGFGSVIVDDVHYADDTATVIDAEGRTRDRDALRLGMSVEVEAGPLATVDGVRTATATRIRYAGELRGALTAVDASRGLLRLLGQTVRVDANTVVDDRLAGGVAALRAGDRLEVHAAFDAASGQYRATRLEPADDADGWHLRGLVEAVDAGARTLRIGTALFDFQAAGTAPAGLGVGEFVRVTIEPDAGARLRFAVRRFGAAALAPADGQAVRLKGFVTAFDSLASLRVNGREVNAASASFPDGPDGVRLGARIEVEGTMAAGVVMAARVELRSDGRERERGFDLRGAITAVQAGAFTLRGVTVGTTRSDLELRDGTLADLVVGRRVRVRAQLADDRTHVEATRIEFDD